MVDNGSREKVAASAFGAYRVHGPDLLQSESQKCPGRAFVTKVLCIITLMMPSLIHAVDTASGDPGATVPDGNSTLVSAPSSANEWVEVRWPYRGCYIVNPVHYVVALNRKVSNAFGGNINLEFSLPLLLSIETKATLDYFTIEQFFYKDEYKAKKIGPSYAIEAGASIHLIDRVKMRAFELPVGYPGYDKVMKCRKEIDPSAIGYKMREVCDTIDVDNSGYVAKSVFKERFGLHGGVLYNNGRRTEEYYDEVANIENVMLYAGVAKTRIGLGPESEGYYYQLSFDVLQNLSTWSIQEKKSLEGASLGWRVVMIRSYMSNRGGGIECGMIPIIKSPSFYFKIGFGMSGTFIKKSP